MREQEMLDKNMPESTNTVLCARVGDLIAYLYGEANEKEAFDFHNHLSDCATCRAELSTFGDVREGIGAWRDAALNPMAVRESDNLRSRNAVETIPRRSAIGALREFFTLSPLWLRGATAFASLLFVALLFVTAWNFVNRSGTEVARQTPSAPVKTEQPNSNSLINNQNVLVPEGNITPVDGETSQLSKPKTSVDRAGTRPKSVPRKKAIVLSNEELSDMLIAAKDDEESVPRLYDLLYESY